MPLTFDYSQEKDKSAMSEWSWLCGIFFIGHSWKDVQPEKLKDSPHKRVQCRRCDIIRWRFKGESYDEIEKIFDGAKSSVPTNRAMRRKQLTH